MPDGAAAAHVSPSPLMDAVWTPCVDGRLEAGVIRIIAASPASPIVKAVLAELRRLEPSARPMVLALLARARGTDGELLTAAGDTRLLDLRGGRDLREQALLGGGALWLGERLSATPALLEHGRMLDMTVCSPEMRDLARLTFDSAWALSAPTARVTASETWARLTMAARGQFSAAQPQPSV